MPGLKIKETSVEKLLAKYRAFLKTNPRSYRAWWLLGRTYSMAYHSGRKNLMINSFEVPVPFYSSEDSPCLPEKYQKAPEGKSKASDLDNAISAYSNAIALAPQNPILRVGFAYALYSRGDKIRSLKENILALDLAMKQFSPGGFVCSKPQGLKGFIEGESGLEIIRILPEVKHILSDSELSHISAFTEKVAHLHKQMNDYLKKKDTIPWPSGPPWKSLLTTRSMIDKAKVTGGLIEQEAHAVGRANMSKFDHCMEEYSWQTNSFKGRVNIEIVIAASGYVDRIHFGKSSMKNDDLYACISKRVKKWRFPRPRAGKITEVVFPFSFSRR